MIPKETIDRLIELGAQAPTINELPSAYPFVVLPEKMAVKSLEELVPRHHVKRCVTLKTAESFCDYVNRFRDGTTLVFADVNESAAKFVAVLDYHAQAGVPGCGPALANFCHHTAVYEPEATQEWITWKAANRKPMPQTEFATWLEENAHIFRAPSGAELLELVETIYATSEARYTGAVRLRSGGGKMCYEEDVTLQGRAGTQQGSLELPPKVDAGFAPFIGAEPMLISARLKYRLESRKLVLWFETIGMHLIVRQSVERIVGQVAEATGIKPMMGRA